MAQAADRLVAGLDAGQRAALELPLPDADADGPAGLADPRFTRWSYLPGPRDGLRLGDLDAQQRELALALLDTGCSAAGARTARAVIDLDIVRRELGGGDPEPGDDRFWFRLFGSPQEHAWAWRVNGHHLAVQVTVVGDEVAVTPSFYGSEPATVLTGPHAGMRVLTAEEDLARDLLGRLDADQLRAAVTSDTAPDDILTRTDPVADPALLETGIGHGDLDRDQQAGLQRLVRHYLDRTPGAAAGRAWAEVTAAGLDQLRLGWAGGTNPGEGHYYSVLGPTILIEYDNTQDDANHIHSLWRDLRHDWGADLLAAHYAANPHSD